jgi:hypothetical protein
MLSDIRFCRQIRKITRNNALHGNAVTESAHRRQQYCWIRVKLLEMRLHRIWYVIQLTTENPRVGGSIPPLATKSSGCLRDRHRVRIAEGTAI